MKNKKLLLNATVVLTLVFAVVALGGCAPSASSESKDGSDAVASQEAVPGSLKAVHVANQLDGVEEYTNKLCLSCHDRDEINEATKDYGGTVGFNPHKSHNAAGDCVSCHSVDTTPTLTCNSCHNEDLPEGWQSAERGAAKAK